MAADGSLTGKNRKFVECFRHVLVAKMTGNRYHSGKQEEKFLEYITMQDAWDQIEAIPGYAKKKSTRLKVREFLGLLGNPDETFAVIHVAGTNGKGSVCAFLTSMLLEAGIHCGTFVSPHLTDIRERFLIDGTMVSESLFTEAFCEVKDACKAWMQAGNPHPTYFEFLFYMGMVMFRNAKVKVLVLETGMGGTHDVTNVAEAPLVSVITSISIDHTAFLGSTIPEIAAHKAGIIKEGRPVIFDGSSPEAACVIRKQAEKMQAPCFAVMPEEVYREKDQVSEENGELLFFPYRGKNDSFTIMSAAPYQKMNAALAIRALDVSKLPVTASQAAAGILKMKWPARMEEIMPGVFLDGAHNEDGIHAFLDAACRLKDRRIPRHVRLLFAVSSDKDYQTMLSEIADRLHPDLCMLSKMESHRTLSMDGLRAAKEALQKNDHEKKTEYLVSPDVKSAVNSLLSLHQPDDLTLIAGSLYLAGEVKEWMQHMTDGASKEENI